MITITSKKNGFRRCGIAHADVATSYKDDAFSAEQLEILQAEPMLTVVFESKKLTKAEEKAAEAEAKAKAEKKAAEAKAKAEAEAKA